MQKSYGRIRLRTTLVAPFVLQTVAVVGLVGYLSFRNGQEAVNQLASQLRLEVASRTQRVMADYFRVPHQITRSNIHALELNQINLQDKQALERYFFHQLQVFPTISEAYVGRPDGSIVYVGQQADGSFVSNTTTTFPQRERYELDQTGRRRKFLKPGEFDSRTRPWYQGAVAKQSQSWTGVYPFATLQTLGISAAEPYYDRQGKLVAVFANSFPLKVISDFLKTLKISPTGQVLILDQAGYLIATSTDEDPFIKIEDNKLQQLRAVDSRNVLTRETAKYLQQFGDLKQIQGLQQLDFTINNQRQYLLVQPYSDGRGLDLLILVVVPEADFIEQISDNTWVTFILCLGALLITILIGMQTSRWIARPIHRVAQAAESLAQGNLNQQVYPSAIIEIETLALSFNSMANQLKELILNLEDKVEERTAKLAQANQEIQALNQRLKTENLRMSAELDILRQMQQMILPRQEELAAIVDLDIAGFMQPAEEVGGDYYDVLHRDGITTISIGDVTGHGLESGILMVMTQAAVRTLKEMEESDPVRFLATLNRTLYQNIQRMNSDRNLTLAVLNYVDRRLTISGQHEETILVRADGIIEPINMMDLGFPIGLDEDITDFVSHILVELNSGDGVVLYTDGITEARNVNRKQYGIGRLCAIVSRHWQQSAEAIKEAVIADLRQHIGAQKIFDDITLLVVKQK